MTEELKSLIDFYNNITIPGTEGIVKINTMFIPSESGESTPVAVMGVLDEEKYKDLEKYNLELVLKVIDQCKEANEAYKKLI